MKKLLLVFFLTGWCCSVTYSQTELYAFSNTEVSESDVKAEDGTYEFQRTSKIEAVYTVEEMEKLLRLIEKERRDTEDVYVVYSRLVTIYIPSKSTLSSK